MKKNLFVLFCLFFILIGGSLYSHIFNKAFLKAPKENTLNSEINLTTNQICKRIFPEATTCIKSETTPPFYTALNARKDILGSLLFTQDYAPEVRGFAGPIHMALGISNNLTIKKVEILSHSETPSYVSTINEYIRQFENKKIDTVFSLGTNIDGITRATISSKAVVNTINQTNTIFDGIQSLDKVAETPLAQNDLDISQIIIPLILFAFAVFSLYVPQVKLRWKILFVSFMYLGLSKATMLSTIQVINIVLGKCPPFLTNPLSYAIIGLTLISLIFWGNVYCGSICPFAAVEEGIHTIFSHLTSRFKKADQRLRIQIRILKYIFLFSIITASLFLQNSDIAIVEVFVLFFSRNATILGWIFIASILLFSIFYHRFWCRFLCPIGALNGLIGSFSLHKIRIKNDACNHCKKCVTICPMDAIESKAGKISVEYSQCIVCNKCLNGCPQKAIEFK